MGVTVFSGAELSSGERFESWRAMVCSSHAPVDVWAEGGGDFDATQRLLDLGPVRISEFDSTPVRSRRTRRHISRSDPGLYFLSFVRTGGAAVQQSTRQGILEPGDLMLYSMSHVHEGRLAPGRRTHMVELILPRTFLPLPAGHLDRVLATRLPARTGLGALLRDMVGRLTEDTSLTTPATAGLLARATAELATAFLVQAAGREDPPDARPDALALRLRVFIHQNLADPALTPPVIAAAHHISLRTLHRVFAATGTTVSAHVREARLQRARRALTDPALRTTPIHEIAASCGFPRPSDFTRAFRARFGVPPSDCRAGGLR
jgi:AraC-like DNA-binding protein